MDRFLIRFRIVARIVAWSAIAGIVILSVVPANERPMIAEPWFDEWVGHFVEHFSAFALAAAAFTIGYCRFSLLRLLLLAFFFSAGIELLQIPMPTRHARTSDFIVDFVALFIAIAIVRIGIGVRRHFANTRLSDKPPDGPSSPKRRVFANFTITDCKT
jgi:VanZ family protein